MAGIADRCDNCVTPRINRGLWTAVIGERHRESIGRSYGGHSLSPACVNFIQAVQDHRGGRLVRCRRERGRGTGRAAGRVGCHKIVGARIAGLHIGDCQRRPGCPGYVGAVDQIDAVPPPLEGGRGKAGGGRRKGGRAADHYSDVVGFGNDGGGQRRPGADENPPRHGGPLSTVRQGDQRVKNRIASPGWSEARAQAVSTRERDSFQLHIALEEIDGRPRRDGLADRVGDGRTPVDRSGSGADRGGGGGLVIASERAEDVSEPTVGQPACDRLVLGVG